MVRRGDMMNIDDIVEILAVELLGVVPDDEKIVVSTNRGEPAVVDTQSRAGEAYRNVARRLQGENVPFMNLEVEDGFFTRLKKAFGFKG